MCFLILAWQRVVSAANYSFFDPFWSLVCVLVRENCIFPQCTIFLALLPLTITSDHSKPFWTQQNRIKWDWICLTAFQFLIPFSGHLVCRSGSASSAGPVTSKPVTQECFCCHKEQSRGKEITLTYLNGPCQFTGLVLTIVIVFILVFVLFYDCSC